MKRYVAGVPILVTVDDVKESRKKIRVGDRIRVRMETYTEEGIRMEKRMWVIVVRKHRFLAEVRPEKTGKRLPVMTVAYKDLVRQRVE